MRKKRIGLKTAEQGAILSDGITPSSHAAAGSSEIGKILQAGTSGIDGPGYALGCFRVVARDPFANALEIFGGTSGPPSGPQEPFKTLADLLMREILATP